MADSMKSIPEHGMDKDHILSQMEALSAEDVRWQDHRAFALVYHHSEEHTDLLKAAHGMFFSANGLNPMAFKSLQVMERDVTRMTASMFHGDEKTVGTMTSGGTESLLLAVLTYRDRARKKKPWIRRPEIVIPESAHTAFIKAGEYFDVTIVRVPVRADFRADVDAMARRINRNTIAIVGSAPCYPYGVVDPIEDLGALAQCRNLPLHVDACLGGFFLPWVERLGHRVPPFDFRVPGVTSISADVHKYGYAAKGASTIVYRNMDYLRHQFYADVNWCGGVYAGATMAGTRPGGPIAAAWASLHALGEEGFLSNARTVMDTAKRLQEGIGAIPELYVLGEPEMGVFAYAAKDKGFSVYALGDFMERKGWSVDRLQRPESLHAMLNPGHAKIVEPYLNDLREGVAYVKAHPGAAFEGMAPMYGLIAKAPMRRMVRNNVLSIIGQLYSGDGAAPDLDAASDGAGTPPGVPKPVLALMRMKAKLGSIWRQG